MSNVLRDFAERIRKRIAEDQRPLGIFVVHSDEEADRVVADYQEKWGPDHDLLIIHLGHLPEAEEMGNPFGA